MSRFSVESVPPAHCPWCATPMFGGNTVKLHEKPLFTICSRCLNDLCLALNLVFLKKGCTIHIDNPDGPSTDSFLNGRGDRDELRR